MSQNWKFVEGSFSAWSILVELFDCERILSSYISLPICLEPIRYNLKSSKYHRMWVLTGSRCAQCHWIDWKSPRRISHSHFLANISTTGLKPVKEQRTIWCDGTIYLVVGGYTPNKTNLWRFNLLTHEGKRRKSEKEFERRAENEKKKHSRRRITLIKVFLNMAFHNPYNYV